MLNCFYYHFSEDTNPSKWTRNLLPLTKRFWWEIFASILKYSFYWCGQAFNRCLSNSLTATASIFVDLKKERAPLVSKLPKTLFQNHIWRFQLQMRSSINLCGSFWSDRFGNSPHLLRTNKNLFLSVKEFRTIWKLRITETTLDLKSFKSLRWFF